MSVLSSFSSCSAAGVLGGSKEAIHEGCAAGEAEKLYGAGKDFSPHRQELRAHDRGGTQRQNCGHQHGEQTVDLRFIFGLTKTCLQLKIGFIQVVDYKV